MTSNRYKRTLEEIQLFHGKRWRKKLRRARKKTRITTGNSAINARFLENSVKGKVEEIHVPQMFSLVEHPDEALEMFAKIGTSVRSGFPIKLDLSEVEKITVDALLYLLATFDRFEQDGNVFRVGGNLPLHTQSADRFKRSGFLRYVSSSDEKTMVPLDNMVQIHGGDKVDPAIAKELCELVQKSFGWLRQDTKFLYELIIEMFANTSHHAYSKLASHPKWYVYAEYEPQLEEVTFCVLDVGKGIPTTVRKRFRETLKKLTGLGKISDAALIDSALNGAFRTRTGQKYRGKGLPTIYAAHQQGKISDLVLISNLGYLNMSSGNRDCNTPLEGTLFTWKVRKNGHNYSNS